MKEFWTMSEALAEAVKISDEWICLPGKERVGWDDALLRAYDLDAAFGQEDLTGRFSYFCSEEGAVGISEGREYMIEWILLPAPGYSDEIENAIRSDFERSKQKMTRKKFCGQCGKEISPDSGFCCHCGAKV